MTQAEVSRAIQAADRELEMLGILNNGFRGSAQRVSIEELERRIALLGRVLQFLIPVLRNRLH